MNKFQISRSPAVSFSALLLPVAVALVLSGCGQPAAQEVPPSDAPSVSVATVIEKTIMETQEFSGRLEAVDRVEIRPRVSGFIASVNFTPGARVKKGDLLFVIDPRPYEAEASRTEAAMLAARARADLARLEFERAEKLVADRAISQREAEEKAATMKELQASARAAEAAWEAARLNLGFTRVHAPIDGRVSKAEVTAGNLVDPNVILTSVVSNDPIHASFDGDEDTYLRVGALARQGKAVTVRVGLANEQGFPHEGRLEFVDNRLDPTTGSVRMRAILPNSDGVLAPGLFARVQLAAGNGTGGATSALLIHERAIGTDQNRKFVYVIGEDNKAEYRPVVLGPLADGLRVVRDGLKPGEKIVVNGLQRVRPGAPVMAKMVSMDAGQSQPATATAQAAPESKS